MTEPLTYHDFFEEFNAFSNYHACRSILGPVIIVDNETGEEVAELCATVWIFFKHSAGDWLITLTLENGEPAYFMRDHIVYFTKY